MKSSKINVQFDFVEGISPLLNLSVKKTSAVLATLEIFEIEASNFILVSQHSQDFKLLLLALKENLVGRYLVLEINAYADLVFYVGINYQWLSQEFEEQLDSTTFLTMLSEIIIKWETDQSNMAFKHHDFQKKYESTTQKSLLIKGYFYEIVLLIIAEIALNKTSKLNFKTIELQKVIDITETAILNFQLSAPTVKEMATKAGMSVSKFKILFYDVYQQTPRQYLLNKKMIYAKSLLDTGLFSITQVAYKVGYHHPSGFLRVYNSIFQIDLLALQLHLENEYISR